MVYLIRKMCKIEGKKKYKWRLKDDKDYIKEAWLQGGKTVGKMIYLDIIFLY